ncbi:MAG: galactokinase [Balneolaceae bacterium]
MNAYSLEIYREFQRHFDSKPMLIESPGRVNLIGEHTDYNEGYVLPAAIDKRFVLALAPNNENKIRLRAVDMDQVAFETDLSATLDKSPEHWPNYILGCVDQLMKAGVEVGGFDCVFGSDIPIGAGMSSSAALEAGIIMGLSGLFDLKLSKLEMAQLAQRAENDFVGVQCGIMDQFACLHGKQNRVIRLDCRSLEFSHYPFNQEEICILLCDTKVRRELAGSEYNTRRRQCEEGVEVLRKTYPEINSLRDVTLTMLKNHRDHLDPVIYNRCRYVIEENQRVLAGCLDLEDGNLISFGKLMYESHNGLRHLFEVSCPELDLLVDEAEKLDEVPGARMMGGGFGGCTINLVYVDQIEDVKEIIGTGYHSKFGFFPEFYTAKIGSGTRILSNKNEEPVESIK